MIELYKLPNEWEWKKLEDIANFQNGFAFKSKEFNTEGNGLQVVRIGNVLDINKNPVYIDERKEFEKYLLKKNDIVISMTGTRNKKDYLFLRVIKTNDSYLNQRVGKITNNEKSIHLYLYYFLKSNSFRDKIFEYETGTVNQGNISSKDIMNSNIPTPPLPEQQRIVSKLDLLFEKIDKSIALHQKNMEEANAFMGSVLNDVFGELEEKNNPMLRFDTYTKSSRGHNPPKNDFIYEEREGYVRFIQIRDGSSDNNAVYVPITKKLHLVTKDDLLLVAYRQVGKVFKEMEGAFNVALCKIENIDNNNLDINYLYYLIQSKYVKDELLRMSERALIPSMSIDHLKSIEIPLPPLPIQQKVVAYLDDISQKLEKIKQLQKEKMASLKALKASILDSAFRGEL